jgi:two-component system OmpR family response regulator
MKGHRIVLVDDDEGIRMIGQMSLEQLGGHEVLALGSGEEALEQAAGFSPGLLVLDVSMPGLDGPQTLASLRKQPDLRDVPAIFLTAHTQAKDVARFRALGALDVVAKPFDPEHLCERVAAVLGMAATVPAAGDQRVALIVEDDPGIRYLLRFILEQEGWRVIEAHDGHEGVAAILDGPVTDAVLLDIMLPHIDGLQLLDTLRGVNRWQGVPVMMLTAKGDEPSVKRALAGGANDYLGKPFDPAELAARLKRLPLRALR